MQSDNSHNSQVDADTVAQLTEAAARCYEQGDYAAAHTQYRQALDAWLALRGPDVLGTATA
jgi:hypothetical protein